MIVGESKDVDLGSLTTAVAGTVCAGGGVHVSWVGWYESSELSSRPRRILRKRLRQLWVHPMCLSGGSMRRRTRWVLVSGDSEVPDTNGADSSHSSDMGVVRARVGSGVGIEGGSGVGCSGVVQL